MGWLDRAKATVLTERQQATSKVQEAAELVAGEHRERAEALMRSALGNLRRAFLWDERSQHLFQELHRLGLSVHDQFGCEVPKQGESYMVECPVLLAHAKIGFSIGGTSDSICSICGEDTFDCEHVRGESYDAVEARRIRGACNICLSEKECEHKMGHRYDGVEPAHIITNIRLDEISLVERPSNPDAVITSRTLGKDEILESLSAEERAVFSYGETPLDCHHCAVCDGSPD